jgi:hypothetical protein
VLICLLLALFAAFGSEAVLAKDVLGSPSLRTICQGRSSGALGKLFSRASGAFVNSLRIERFGEESHVALWRVGTLGFPGTKDAINAA